MKGNDTQKTYKSEEDMKNNRLFTTICLMAAALLTACTQDELAEQGTALPDGEYPLQIGSVSITAEASEEPWTRVTEKPDGSGSVWQPDDAITVSLDGETATYTYDGSAWTSDTPLYWKNTQTAEVTAWYPATDGVVNLSDQDRNGLTYVLRGTGTGNHQSPVTLKFEHQLAKVRVVAKGTAEVRDISIWNVPTICYIEEGKITGQDNSTTGIIPMLSVEREGIGACWEASVGPDVEIKYFSLDGMNCELTSPVTTQAGALHTITWTVNNEETTTIDLSNSDYTINGDGTYYFSGTGSHAIRVTGGNPEIYLEDAQISVSSGNAIGIQDGSPTIHVRGEGNTVASTDNTGIAVSGGATLTIEGRGTADMLTATGGYVDNGSSANKTMGAGIGSPIGGTQAGNIVIRNVTIHATGGSIDDIGGGAGIGSSCNGTCGDITIENAVVTAMGGCCAAAIGMGCNYNNSDLYAASIGEITITNSDVTATGGMWAAAIGFPFSEQHLGAATYRAGKITITTADEATFVSKLKSGEAMPLGSPPQRIGKGAYAATTPTFLNTDGTGPWEGVVINGTAYADGYE